MSTDTHAEAGRGATATPRHLRPADSQGAAPRAWVAFWLPFSAVVAIAFVAQRDLFSTPLQAWGDSAVNGLSVLRAEHLHQLVGNYSRVGFHHPGPGFMYLLAAGEVVFHDVLHVAPAAYNGQLLGTSVFVAGALAVVCLVVYRSTRSVPAAALAFGAAFVLAARMPLLGQDWFPYLYVSTYLVVLVSGMAVAAGRTAEWPWFLGSCGLLAHGHASFLMFSSVSLVFGAATWWWWHRGDVRAEIAAHRTAARWTVAVAALASAPVVADLVLNFPGQWPLYFEFATSAERDPRTAGQLLDFYATSWTGAGLPWPVYFVALVLGVVLLVVDRTRGRRLPVVFGYALLGLQTVLYLYYLARGVDHLVPLEVYEYVGFFYRAVPTALLVLVAAQVCLFVAAGDPARWDRRSAAAAVVLTSLVVVFALEGATVSAHAPGGQSFGRAAQVLQRLDGDRGRVIVLQNDVGEMWATTAGIGLELSRLGESWCTRGPNAEPIMFGAEHVCTPGQTRRGMLVAFTNAPLPEREEAVWRDTPVDPRLGPGPISAYLPRR